MNFEPVIGIEIHVEMKTKSKMFSGGPIAFGKEPNTQVVPLDMGFPGTMPVVNKQAVINAIRVCDALNMEIDHTLVFDRKNYFYADLPKGFQITQDKRPIGKEGYLEITVNDQKKRIEIERLHLEEDTCKQFHLEDYSLLDYNRAGTPLIEIVTKPCLRSGLEAMKYVEAIKSIVIYKEVSDGKMEEGSLRCDVNISLRPYGSDAFGTKVEIKNLNSTANLQKAVEFEIKRQTQMLLKGEQIDQETRRFDEAKKETVLMRKKTDSVDYKYFVEPNITPIKLSSEFINQAIETAEELAEDKKKRYIEKGLSEDEADQILLDKDLASFFDQAINKSNKIKAIWNFVTVDILSYLKKERMVLKDLEISFEGLARLIDLIDAKDISYNQGRIVFNEMVKSQETPDIIVERLGLKQNSNIDEIEAIVVATIDEFPQSVIDYKNGKDRAIGFLVGQIMKKTKGKVNPAITNQLVVKELKKR